MSCYRNNTTWPPEVLRSTNGRHSLINLKLTHHWSQLNLELQSWCATCSGVPGCCAGEHAETVCSSGLQECQLAEFGRCPLVILNLCWPRFPHSWIPGGTLPSMSGAFRWAKPSSFGNFDILDLGPRQLLAALISAGMLRFSSVVFRSWGLDQIWQ